MLHIYFYDYKYAYTSYIYTRYSEIKELSVQNTNPYPFKSSCQIIKIINLYLKNHCLTTST